MDYLWIELTGPYKSSVLDPIKASSDLVTPTKIFLEKFEVPCLPGSSACAAELKNRMKFSQAALNAFVSLAPEQLSSTDITDPSCASGGGTGIVDASGYSFPVVLAKSLISNGYSWPCKTSSPYCHHDQTPAFDISKKPNNQTAGVTIVAIDSGTITKIGMDYKGTGCQSIQYKGDNGRYYWYGHIRTDSKTPKVGAAVTAGTYLGKVGESICTGNGSYPHLHIDMGYPGMTAGVGPNRDPAFIPLMNSLYEKLPD
jgi:murein DD-endopeptidase MepM/ murein hydrolase activator NlpD